MPNPCDVIQVHVTVSRETVARLEIYCDLLLKWQKQINLISNDTIQDVWRRHFLDAAQLINHLPPSGQPVIDMGSGGGFPGMVVAIMKPELDMHLLESDKRKTIFLKEVARATNTTVSIHHGRIEDNRVGKAGLVLSRACADISQLLSWSESYVSHETISYFHKGKNYATELQEAEATWQFDRVIHASVTDPQSAIVQLSNISRRV